MRVLALIAAAAMLSLAPAQAQIAANQPAQRSIDIATHVSEASQRFGVPKKWIYAVMRVESAGRVGAISSAGAMGLMQLMPGTWARQRARFGLGSDPFNPRDNIMAGTSYLREMYDSYGVTGMLAAYNAGPGRYEQWRNNGRPLPAETRAYVARIEPMLQSASASTATASANGLQPMRTSWRQSQLFAARSEPDDIGPNNAAIAAPSRPTARSVTPSNGLFVTISRDRL
jgi:membrane-bound lytic murein transglycosylase B